VVEVDFAQEKEQGYQRIFARSPLISQISEMEMPVLAQAERTLDGKFRRKQVTEGDFLIAPANVGHRAGWQGMGGVLLIGIDLLLILQVTQESRAYRQRKLLP